MHDIKQSQNTYQKRPNPRAAEDKDSVRGLSGRGNRYGGFGVHYVATRERRHAIALGAGSGVTKGNRQSVFARTTTQEHHTCRCEPGGGCAVGDGGRAALQSSELRYRRGLGRSKRAGFHSHQTSGTKGRIPQTALLAGPARGLPKFKCCTQSMARHIIAFPAAPTRPANSRRSTLAGGTVPLTRFSARNMGGNI